MSVSSYHVPYCTDVHISTNDPYTVNQCPPMFYRFVAVGGIETFVKTNASVYRFDAAYQLPANLVSTF